jgi:hypothetical protein
LGTDLFTDNAIHGSFFDPDAAFSADTFSATGSVHVYTGLQGGMNNGIAVGHANLCLMRQKNYLMGRHIRFLCCQMCVSDKMRRPISPEL